ncbi:dihydrodipicolinate synthase family protein [Haloarcula marina]|uniref:dihydrodipicolinate synthase family protein n=1 Tax=Haloarcula marina TaxID=2961574 RepID=UPI0020B70F4E|nr:dihydrodipicolinate synthase family protein [Halomicroarcula marina]
MSKVAADIKTRLRGVAVGLLTPFDDDRSIEHDKLTENAKSLYDEGIRTFLVAANISEYHSLSQDERIEIATTGVDALPDDALVLGGVGGSTADATELIRAYDQVGVDVMMIMPPDHTYLHEQGLLQYYSKLGEATDRPLVPYVRGFDPSIQYLADLTHLENVIGIKYAIEDPVKLGAAVEKGADDVVWINGLAEPYALSYWMEGVEGFSAGVSNFRPEVGLELFDALAEEDWERARKLRDICLPYQRFRSETGSDNTLPGANSVAAIKAGLELAGLHGGNVREPIVQLNERDKQRAEELYLQLDDEISQLIN